MKSYWQSGQLLMLSSFIHFSTRSWAESASSRWLYCAIDCWLDKGKETCPGYSVGI